MRKITIGFAFLLWIVILPLYAYKVHLKEDYTDFSVYYRAAERIKNQQWHEIYTLQDGASPFRYAPVFLPAFRPFAEFSPHQAKMAWFFLQYLWLSLGFYWIYRTLRSLQHSTNSRVKTQSLSDPSHLENQDRALFQASLSLLFILRFCLDTLTIGQSSSLIFLALCGGFYAFVNRRPIFTALCLLVPTLFKIGPGIVYGVFATTRKKEWSQALLASLGASTLLILFSSIWIESHTAISGISKKLWADWIEIVAKDSVYYDASHYGSQSLKSVLLRLAKEGVLSPAHIPLLYWGLGLGVILACGSFWILRKPRSLRGRGLHFSLGLFIPIWLMPETFKYSLTPLAIPAALLFSTPKKDRLFYLALGLGIFSLSLSGKDIVGDFLFFGNQKNSLPFLATLFLGALVGREAWTHSTPSRYAQMLTQLFFYGRKQLGPWKKLPQTDRNLQVSLLIPLPLCSDCSLSPSTVKSLILETHSFLESNFPICFEIILIFYGNRISGFHPLAQMASSLQLSGVRILNDSHSEGRGEALRAGFLECLGQKLLFLQVEQPVDTRFFKEAIPILDSGYDLVRANRRLPLSQFKIPVRLLSRVYGRHRLGLLFNRLVRAFLPIQTTDTHAGSLAISWKLASQVFALQTSPDFLFDLELCLISAAQGFREKDLAVTLALALEKSPRRIILETWQILQRLPRLAWRYHKGYYQTLPNLNRITADDWGLSPGINQGILKLAKKGIVRRVSMMANCPYLEEGLQELCALSNVELGLHFNLTYGTPSPQNSEINRLFLETHSSKQTVFITSPAKFLIRWLNPFKQGFHQKNYVRAELKWQLEKLASHGVRIQYLDGHHHIHLVPGILDAVADLIHRAGVKQIRIPYDRSLWRSTQWPLVALSLWARIQAVRLGFKFYPCIYPNLSFFRDHGKLRARLAQNPEAEIIVHPAETNDIGTLEFLDSYTEGRVVEFQALRMLSFEP